jgi:hypothetical protein
VITALSTESLRNLEASPTSFLKTCGDTWKTPTVMGQSRRPHCTGILISKQPTICNLMLSTNGQCFV